MADKPLHVKPAFYSYVYEELKIIALRSGYNLLLHGSMNRDLDLVAIAWSPTTYSYYKMIMEMTEYLGGEIMFETEEDRARFGRKYHGRRNFVINFNRGGYRDWEKPKGAYVPDPMYYLDISIIPPLLDRMNDTIPIPSN